MKKLTKVQLARYRRLRDLGFTIGQARKMARMTTGQIADVLVRELRKQQRARDVALTFGSGAQ